MQNSSNQPSIPSISLVLKKISDDRALTLFNSIAIADGDKYIPLKEMNLTTKQYYSRISGLLDVGLIKRHKGKYSLTLLGRVVYYAHMTIGKTLTYYWKLRAIDAFEISASGSSRLTNDEITQMIDVLIDNSQIKDILMKSTSIPVFEKSSDRFKAETIVEDTEEKNLE